MARIAIGHNNGWTRVADETVVAAITPMSYIPAPPLESSTRTEPPSARLLLTHFQQRSMKRSRLALAALSVVVFAGCKADSSDSLAPKKTSASPARRALTVVRSKGVIGTPTSDSTAADSGRTLPYSFSAIAGYENLRVFLDGAPVDASGAVLMDANHSLTALASVSIAVSDAVAPQVEATTTATAQLKNPAIKPMDAYRALAAATADLAAHVSADSVDHFLRVARLRSLSTADADRIAHAILEINDSLAVEATAGPAALEANDEAPGAEVTYLFVNGIWTLPSQLEGTTDVLRQNLTFAGLTDASKFRTDRFYNPMWNSGDSRSLAFLICMQLIADAAAEGQNPMPDAACNALALRAAGISDLKESVLQVTTRVFFPNADRVTPSVSALADRISSVAATSRVVVVAHSQGNLLLHEAFREIDRRHSLNGRCIGTVSLAPPMKVTPMGNSTPVSASFVAGTTIKDVLLYLNSTAPGVLDISSVPTNRNSRSDALDATYAALTNFWVTLLSGGVSSVQAGILYVAGGLDLHLVKSDYLTANRATTAALLKNQTDDVLKRCASGLEFSSTPASVTVGTAMTDFDVRVLGPNGLLADKASVAVTLAIGANPSGARLSGTTTVQSVNGIAHFTGLTLDRAGSGFTLVASTPGSPNVTTPPFNVGNNSIGIRGLVFGVSSDGSSSSPLVNASIDVKRGSTSAFVTHTASDGSYEATDLISGTYTVTASKAGYTTATIFDVETLSAGALTLPNILLVPSSPNPGAISGSILHAQTNAPLSGMTVQLRAGINASTGTPIATTTSAGDGTYQFSNVSAGTYTVSAGGPGFVTSIRTGISVGGGLTVTNQNVSLAPATASGTWRVVLTWGATPSDLDSHLTGPLGTGRFHVFYSNKGSIGSAPFAELDVDDVTSFGPETITLTNLGSGMYRYSVHDYSNRDASSSTSLASSGAEVKVYEGATLKARYFVPNEPGTLWTVFQLSNGVLSPVNTMTYQSNPGAVQQVNRRSCAFAATDADCIRGTATTFSKPPSN